MSRAFFQLSAMVAATALLAGGCERKKPAADEKTDDDPKTVAVVGPQRITVEDVARRVEQFSPQQQQLYRHSSAARRRLLEQMIEEELIVAIAKKRGYDRDPRIERALHRLLMNRIREDVAAMVKLDQITEAQARAYYESHPRKFRTRLSLHARHILVEDKTQAEKLAVRARGKSEKAFAALARRYSKDARTRGRGGDLGAVSRPGGAMPSPVFRAALGLKQPGEVAGPVRSKRGWHVVYLVDKQLPKPRPFEQVKVTARLGAFHDKRDQLYRQFLGELRQKFEVVRHPRRLDQLKKRLSGR